MFGTLDPVENVCKGTDGTLGPMAQIQGSCLEGRWSTCIKCNPGSYINYLMPEFGAIKQKTACAPFCFSDTTEVTYDGQVHCKPTCEEGYAFTRYYGCHICPQECPLRCKEETLECYIENTVVYKVDQFYPDDLEYDIYFKLRLLNEDLSPLDPKGFTELTKGESLYDVYSEDFDTYEFFEPVVVVKNSKELEITLKLRWAQNKNLKSYSLEF
jgi:hypothetical protein